MEISTEFEINENTPFHLMSCFSGVELEFSSVCIDGAGPGYGRIATYHCQLSISTPACWNGDRSWGTALEQRLKNIPQYIKQ